MTNKSDAASSTQPLDACVTELRAHYNTDWDTTVPGKEFDAEIRRILSKLAASRTVEQPEPDNP